MKSLITMWLLLGLVCSAASQQVSQSPDTSTSQNTAADSSVAKAAERKRHFEEQKQRIEGQEQPVQTPACQAGKPTLYITPDKAGMLIGEFRGFALFDTDGHKLTAAADWSVSSSYHATLRQGDEPTVTAKNEGTFKVTARIDTRIAEATIKVYRDKLPIGATIWSVAPVPCGKSGGISRSVQAAPH
jgi:plastocyanin